MNENVDLQICSASSENGKIYHFAADANAKLDGLQREYRQLVQKYQATLDRCVMLETALNRALACLARLEAANVCL